MHKFYILLSGEASANARRRYGDAGEAKWQHAGEHHEPTESETPQDTRNKSQGGKTSIGTLLDYARAQIRS